MVCLRNICINTLHKGDNDDDDNNDNNNNNNNNIPGNHEVKKLQNTAMLGTVSNRFEENTHTRKQKIIISSIKGNKKNDEKNRASHLISVKSRG